MPQWPACNELYSYVLYRKHQCPVHHSCTGKVINDDRLKKEYNPKTHYQLTFQTAASHTPPQRPGLKVPPRILPDIPKKRVRGEATVSVNHTDYVKLPLMPTKSFKPDSKAHQCEAKLDNTTSYKLDFPEQRLVPGKPQAHSLMLTTIPRIAEVPLKENYVTTNQQMLARWEKGGRQAGYCELPSQLHFVGDFDGKSVHKRDYNAAILEEGKPSTSCKREERLHSSNKPFHDMTTSKAFHSNLPELMKRDPLFLKKRSINNKETMKPPSGPAQNSTQYRTDNPGYVCFPHVRGICTPAQDQLYLFYGKFDGKTEHHSNYVQFQEPPRPRTSFKKVDNRHTDGATFDGTTSMELDYQPIPFETQMAGLKNVDSIAAQVGHYQKGGEQMKRAHHFGGRFADKSVYKDDYFQFRQIRPRERHGDKAERPFIPSKAKLASISEAAANFVPLSGKPSQSFKPLDTRFADKHGDNGSRKTQVNYSTAYEQDFIERPLPRKELCQAELLLQKV